MDHMYVAAVSSTRTRLQVLWKRLLAHETIAAATMVAAAITALILANTSVYEPLEAFMNTPLEIGFGASIVALSVRTFINDFLMAIFFLLVGIELKYEVTVGHLTDIRSALLPLLAAVGGVCMPALLYLLIAPDKQGGWAIPIATDIAFALGVASLLGKRLSPATKVFFQTLAIADDILAIVVIAVWYGHTPHVGWLCASACCVGVLVLLNRRQVYSLKPYVIVGLLLWICMFNSGIHSTLAGVLVAWALPAHSDIRVSDLASWLTHQARYLEHTYDEDHHILGMHDFTEGASDIERVVHRVTPPLQRMEHLCAGWVNFLILPLFAFANAELHIVGQNLAVLLADPVMYAVLCGAVMGKPVGIVLTTLVLRACRLADLPQGMDVRQLITVGIFGALGFTMSILISDLAFVNQLDVLAAKCAIVAASLVASLCGIAWSLIALPAHHLDIQQCS